MTQVSVALVQLLHLHGHLMDGLVVVHLLKLELLALLLQLLPLALIVQGLVLQVRELLIDRDNTAT